MANYNLTQTGAQVQQLLDTVAAGYVFLGTAQPTDTPVTTNPNVCYLATTAGTYTNFGSVTLDAGKIAVLCWDGSSWTKHESAINVVTDATPIANSVNPVQSGGVYQKIAEIVGSPSVTFVKSDYELNSGLIVASTGKFQSNGNYGIKNRYALIPVSDYKGRTIAFTPADTGMDYAIALLKSNSLVSGSVAPFCDDYTATIYTQSTCTIPQDCNYLYVFAEKRNDADSPWVDKWPSLVMSGTDSPYCTNERVDAIEEQIEGAIAKYGVRWSTTDLSDLGERCFDAVGLSATIGVGNTNGSSDFDSIYPWSGMKRCNISTNANGAKVITYEGETGFALDGTNGDVFVEIPKFKCEAYIKDNKEYRVIGSGNTHPAFVEDGKELDAIYVGAFEGYVDNNALYSHSAVVPSNNLTGSAFLTAAQARGNAYTLADLRSVDAIWTLMAVEYGCRNSNRVIGYGYGAYFQPVAHTSAGNLWQTCTVAATSTNTITLGKPDSNGRRLAILDCLAPGNTIVICDGTQQNIVAERKITAITCASTSDNVVVTFDGSAINTATTMFAGNGGAITNYCESITSGALSWHTGRANKGVTSGSGLDVNTFNPCRYRWIENPVGSLWQFLPDVNFNNLQMYICPNMKDYSMGSHASPYTPIGALLPKQDTNGGSKTDVNNSTYPNYWITSLLYALYLNSHSYGATFDTAHDNDTLTSTKGYGGYYYLNNGNMLVVNGGGFDHLYRCNMLTNRAQVATTYTWYLYGARLMFKEI